MNDDFEYDIEYSVDSNGDINVTKTPRGLRKKSVRDLPQQSIYGTGQWVTNASTVAKQFKMKPLEDKFIVMSKNGKRLSNKVFDTVMEALSHADTFDEETIVDKL